MKLAQIFQILMYFSNFNDLVLIPYKTSKDFIEFGDLSSFNDYSDIKGEDNISECKSIIKKLEIKLSDKKKNVIN